MTNGNRQNRWPGSSPGQHKSKFGIPAKGRIRVALGVALIIAVVRFAGPCDCGGKAGREEADGGGNVLTDSAVSTGENQRGGKSGKSLQSAGMEDNARKPDRARPAVPDFMMTFDDVRSLVNEYDVSVSAPRQRIVTNPNDNRKWRRNNSREDDTLTLFLSIDTTIQKYAMTMLRRYKPRYGAAVAIDPATGRVLALASYAGKGEPHDGVNLCLRSVFPAASVFKTVVAAAGIERGGMSRRTPIPHYGRNHTLYRTQLAENLKASRDVSLQDAFAYSINPAFGRIALFNVSKGVITEYGRAFGYHAAAPFEFDVEESVMLNPDSAFSVAEFASGFNRETTLSPLLGAMMAGAVSYGGIINEPTIVDSIRSSKRDTLIYRRATKTWRRAVKESTASELRWLMSRVTHYGTARTSFRQLRELQRYSAYEFGGKTGSVNQLGLGRVDWFIGFAKNPNNRNQQIAVGIVTTHGEYWTVHSSYIGSEIFKKYISNIEARAKSPAP